MGDPGVSAAGLARRFGSVSALDGVDLEARPGAVTVVLGPNGAGKSTLLGILATLTRPDAGAARVAGVDVRADPATARRNLGLVTHRPLLYPDLTAVENLRFYARLYGVTAGRRPPSGIHASLGAGETAGIRGATEAADPRLDAALDRVGLRPHRHRLVRNFSRGMVQRLAIARATLHQPPVLLLDEPHTGLDPMAADRLDAALAAWAAEGRTVLMTTHDLDRAVALADRLVILHRGRVAWLGDGRGLDGLAVRRVYRDAIEGAGPTTRTPATAGPAAAGPAPADPGVARWRATDGGDTPSTAAARHGTAQSPAAFASAVAAIVWKDLRVELRAWEVLPPVLVFALLVLVIFQFTLPASERGSIAGASGALWVALLFGSSLGLSRALGGEMDSGGMTGLLLAPIDRGALFAGKWLSGWLFGLIVVACLLPAATLWLNLPPARLPALAGVFTLGLVGWVAAGTLLGAMAVATRAREVLLPVLLYPAVLPLVIPAAQLTRLVLEGPSGALDHAAWPALVALVAAFDVIFLVLGFLLLPYVVEG